MVLEGRAAHADRQGHVPRIPRPAMPAGGAYAAVVPHGLEPLCDARRHSEHGRAGAPRGKAREDLHVALAPPGLAFVEILHIRFKVGVDFMLWCSHVEVKTAYLTLKIIMIDVLNDNNDNDNEGVSFYQQVLLPEQAFDAFGIPKYQDPNPKP